jgi:hypothetical protein
MRSAPLPTALALVATLAATAAALAAFLTDASAPTAVFLLLFTVLFGVRVAGQVGVVLFRPQWLPPMEQWNFVPYRVLLPAQVVIIAVMGAIVAGRLEPGPTTARVLVAAALVYWAAMAVRYARRMTSRADQRWFGGAIPIVFHCVLAAFLFVLGAANA